MHENIDNRLTAAQLSILWPLSMAPSGWLLCALKTVANCAKRTTARARPCLYVCMCLKNRLRHQPAEGIHFAVKYNNEKAAFSFSSQSPSNSNSFR